MNDSKIPSTSLLTKSNQRNSLLETNKKNDYSNYSNKSKINRTKLSPHSNKKVLFSNGKKYQINSSFNSISIPNTTNISSKYEQVFSYDNRNFNTSAIKPSKIQDDKFKEEEESPSILNTSLSVFQLEYPDYNSFVYSKINLNSENIISIPKLNFPIFVKYPHIIIIGKASLRHRVRRITYKTSRRKYGNNDENKQKKLL